MPDLWKRVQQAHQQKVETREQNIALLQKAVLQFNRMAQDAYDDAITAQRKYVVGAIGKKVAKMTLAEIINSAIGTWPVGKGVELITEDVIGNALLNEAIGQGVGKAYDFVEERVSDFANQQRETQMDRAAKDYITNNQSQMPMAKNALSNPLPALEVYPGLATGVHTVKKPRG